MEKLIVIVGPTAVGKTEISIQLALALDTEIISGDSMQLYRGMDIGTSKVTEAEKQGIEHYMLDILQPNETYSVAQYKKRVQTYVKKLNDRGKIPLLVGGTGLYVNAVLFDYPFDEMKTDEQIRIRLEAELKEVGNEAMYENLRRVDPKQAEKIHPNNVRRVIRALEIYELTGKTMSEINELNKPKTRYNHLLIGLEMDRKTLYNRINRRVDKMITDGLIEEVRTLYNQGYEHSQAMQAIGYKEIIPYIKNEMTKEEAIELLKRNTRRYAKRQYTWFRNKLDVHWFQPDETGQFPLEDMMTIIENHFQL
ncbi:MAG TPA: tRNA (adenosine(37)-N6)-dimethylallyltransferase MiaA [Pseudogracilibacillus sp.]|nr:tRNA (adenosine(37)-N6)-dimethylallyltransferase MiaA [Pseudogracilibacillus sp.]